MSKIYGIGNPLIDILSNITNDDLNALNLYKGTMHLIDKQRHRELIDYLKSKQLVYSPGGSCPNTMVTLCSLHSLTDKKYIDFNNLPSRKVLFCPFEYLYNIFLLCYVVLLTFLFTF